MEIIKISLQTTPPTMPPLVATMGKFDGVHEAHQALLQQLILVSRRENLKRALITFDRSPLAVIKNQSDEQYLTPENTKYDFLLQFDVDYLIIIEFTKELSMLSPQAFIDKFLLALNVKHVVVGFDYTYGYQKMGNAMTIKADSGGMITVDVIEEMQYDGQKIGSSLIKQLLNDGKINVVNNLLKRPYMVTGIVEKGNQIGRKLKLPTANLAIDDKFVTLKSGVYVVKINVDKHYYHGIANIGHNPSFNFHEGRILEVHLFDFDGDLYGKKISVYFLEYLRNEATFTSHEDFLKQINVDISKAKQWIGDNQEK